MASLNKAIEEYFSKKGKELITILKQKLRKKKATGRTLESLSFKIYKEGEAQTLIIEADETINFVTAGRKAGHLPPIKPIEDWVTTKGLKKNSAWAIAEDLKKNAVKGVSLKSFTKKEDQQIFEDLQELIANVEEENILNELTDEIKKSGLRVQ